MKRTDKLALLNQVLQGDTSQLRIVQADRGKRWRVDQRAAQRTYLSTLLERDSTEQELLHYFGTYDRSGTPGVICIEYASGLYGYLT